jgi:predicted phosphohydrolase
MILLGTLLKAFLISTNSDSSLLLLLHHPPQGKNAPQTHLLKVLRSKRSKKQLQGNRTQL